MNTPNLPTSVQTPNAVVMVRPHRFRSNLETADDNSFQTTRHANPPESVAETAFREVTQMAERLRAEGVRIHLFEDPGDHDTPDSVFPNNWFSTHAGGHIAIYPMYAPSRRRERRADIIEMLKEQYRVQDVIDYSGLERDGIFLEGTGAMVFDHITRVAYTTRSNRANPVALERFCTHFNFEPLEFESVDATRHPVYHTNVLMCIATGFALVSLDMMTDRDRAREVATRLAETGRSVIPLTPDQISAFAGNAIELYGDGQTILALSSRAERSLTDGQKSIIAQRAKLVSFDIPTIESAGGSVRCMLAGIHLSRR